MCANYVKIVNQSELNLPHQFQELLSNKNVYIYGSLIWKLLTKKSFDVNDIDIVIQDKYCYEIMNEFENHIKKNNLYYSKYTKYGYQYSKFICRTCEYWVVNNNKYQIVQFTIIRNDITVEDFINIQLPFKTLRNYYNQGNVYYNNDDLLTEYIPLSKVSKYTKIIKKYSERGVTFSITDDMTNSKKTIPKHILNKYIKKYNKLGMVVIPLSDNDTYGEGKCPVVKNWTNLTLDNKINVNIYNNIGIVCGPNSGIMCIDIDTKDDGVKHFQQLINKYQFPFGTPYQVTPNGGMHYIFKYNPTKMNNLQSKIKFFTLNEKKVGVDFWVNKVQFVAEPSVNKLTGGEYKWEIEPTKDNIPELPDWVIDLYNKGGINDDYEIINVNNYEEPKEDSNLIVSMFNSIYSYFSG